jgi:GxGYxYP putative glycoside hydrolase C-terminal domain/GxGYxYP third domain/GxGYxYP_N second domain/GxGYxYP_N 1st domain
MMKAMTFLASMTALALLVFTPACSETTAESKGDHEALATTETVKAIQKETWEPVFPKSAMPQHLYFYDACRAGYQMQLLMTSLQGVVAKTEPRLYLRVNCESHDQFWLDKMEEYYGVTSEVVTDPWALIDEFADEIDGLIVYDPDLPGTVDIATTLAGIESALVVSPDLLAQVESHGLSVIQDMRGAFSDNAELNEWALDNVWPEANQAILCFLKPELTPLRDYLVRNNIMTFYLDPHRPDERVVLERVLSETPPNIPILGWAVDELLGVMLFSENAKFHVPCDGTGNLSVTSGLPKPELSQDHAGEYSEEIENKTYVTFVYGDGDNLVFSLRYLHNPDKWEDPLRGQIPLGWEISSNLIDLGPQALRYYYETKTENDVIVGPVDGIGYMYPGLYPEKHLDTFMELTKRYFEAADLDTVWLVNNDLSIADDKLLAYTSKLDLAGIFIDYWPNCDKGFYFASDGTPVLRSQYVYLLGHEQIESIIAQKQIEKEYLYPDSPFFLFIGVNAWGTPVGRVKQVIDNLTENHIVLRPDRMFSAMRKAGEEGYVF